MIARCTKKTDGSWDRYGGRGISVCDRWMDFLNFYKDMGPRPDGKQIDRIDNDGDYCPENCRWATRSENSRNKRNSQFVTYEGVRMTLMEASEKSGISFSALWNRLQKGDSDIFRPVRRTSRTCSCNGCCRQATPEKIPA